MPLINVVEAPLNLQTTKTIIVEKNNPKFNTYTDTLLTPTQKTNKIKHPHIFSSRLIFPSNPLPIVASKNVTHEYKNINPKQIDTNNASNSLTDPQFVKTNIVSDSIANKNSFNLFSFNSLLSFKYWTKHNTSDTLKTEMKEKKLKFNTILDAKYSTPKIYPLNSTNNNANTTLIPNGVSEV